MTENVLGLYLGAVALGAVHGVEPGHGWPVAASYALERANPRLFGLAAGAVIGAGHLVSSIAMVGAFFLAKSYFELTQVNEPVALAVGPLGTVEIGGPVSVVAGVVLVLLGVREYRRGGHPHATDDGTDHEHGGEGHGDGHEHGDGNKHEHAHGDGDAHGHSHEHGDGHSHGHEHEHDHGDGPGGGVLARLRAALPFVGGGGHSHDHGDLDEAAEGGLWSVAWVAFLLGFAHEEEFEIIALCAGSSRCLSLMTVYALTVVVGIVGLTLLLVAGYERSRERVERLTPYLPALSAAVLVVMGLGFVLGLF